MSLFKPAFNALFRSGRLTKEVDLGMAIEDVEKLDKKFFNDGFRMRFLYKSWTDGSYQAAWETGSGAQFWLATDDVDEFKQKDKKHFDDGLRLRYLHSQGGHFTAIWHPGSAGQHWVTDVGFNDFKAKDAELKDKGFVLKQFCDDGGSYSGFWQAGSGSYSWISTTDKSQFEQFKEDNRNKGRLAVALGGENLCAVFHHETGDQRLVFGLIEKEFTSKTEELFSENFHIVDFYMTAGD
jgi:hypothetical protein